jgi:hypothetical protein
MDRMIVAGQRECEHVQTQVDDVGLVFFCLRIGFGSTVFVFGRATGSARSRKQDLFIKVPIGQVMDQMIVAGRRECEHALTQVDDVGIVFFCLRIGFGSTVLSFEELRDLLGSRKQVFFS